MSATLNNNLHLSSALKINEESMVSKKQGIVSILAGSDSDQKPLNKAASLRRTLSADMSSRKWLTQHGFTPLKKIASSERFPAISTIDPSSEEGEEDYEERKESEAPTRFDVWASIREEKKEKEKEKSGPFDIWSSIISQKALDKSSLPPPYIHPLVKRSASSLSKKSLEICTESLGSETGSDGFSASEASDVEEDNNNNNNNKEEEVAVPAAASAACFEEEPRIVKYNYDVGKKSSSTNRSFPPPIPSLSNRYGASVRMKTHRDNGRLVLEAVSVPSQNNFLAQRKDGRLVLTFANPTEPESKHVEEEEEEREVKGVEELEEDFGSFAEEDEDEEESEIELELEEVKVKERCYEMEQTPKLSSRLMNVHRLAVMMKKPIWSANRNSTWTKNFDQIEEREDDKEINPTTQPPPLAQSLPPRPPVARMISSPSPPSKATTTAAAAAASFNAYEYYWRKNQQSAILDQPINTKNLMAKNDQQKLLVLRGNKVDYLVPLLKGCKEPRSLLFLEPYCIATS